MKIRKLAMNSYLSKDDQRVNSQNMIIPSYGFWYFDDLLISKDSRDDKSHDPLQQKRRRKKNCREKRERVFVGFFKLKMEEYENK